MLPINKDAIIPMKTDGRRIDLGDNMYPNFEFRTIDYLLTSGAEKTGNIR
ncbi:hypothetical protein [aff. Roholtiella sp. LEGE 12411]|nr:hypothetical protein [aff. Roholtiella sp. LEGE 12411]